MPTILLSGKHSLYWASTSAMNPLFLKEPAIPIINIGAVVAQKFQDTQPTKWLGNEVELFLVEQVKGAAIQWPDLPLPLIAIQNIGILFEPDLAINPTRWLKRLLKTFYILFLWEGKYQQPSLFYWENSPNQHLINLTDVAPQPVVFTE